jgi:hypothetical protein
METETPQQQFFGNAGALTALGGIVLETPKRTGFEYGWCKTDHKDGKEIRRDWRKTDYMNDEPYAGRVQAMLEQLGLPQPKPEEIFRGTHHDLLFLNSHGVVLRIGPTDVNDLVHPGIIQPLGWLEDKENKIEMHGKDIPFTVAIYPGIELIDHYKKDPNPDKPKIVGDLIDLMVATGQGTADVADYNCGIIRVHDDDGHEVAVKMLLDPDNSFNSSSGNTKSQRETRMRQQEESSKISKGSVRLNKGEMLMNTLRDVFNAARNVKYWERAFEMHQPLRHMFWEAFRDVPGITGTPDADARQAFWDKCAAVTNNPTPVTLPVWRTEERDKDNLSFVRDELNVPHLVLYRPWTGKDEDRITKPIEQSPALKAAVERAHRDNINRPTVQDAAPDGIGKEKANAGGSAGLRGGPGDQKQGPGGLAPLKHEFDQAAVKRDWRAFSMEPMPEDMKKPPAAMQDAPKKSR